MHKNSIEILLIFTFVFSHQKRETPLLKSPLYINLYKIVKLVFVLLRVNFHLNQAGYQKISGKSVNGNSSLYNGIFCPSLRSVYKELHADRETGC